jgi:O-acetyl-ADP-ribose deacetylase (regulator of RNase III)
MVNIVKGDLFDCQADAITCTVNCKGVMGKGIAKEFKRRYPEMFTEYAKLCKQGRIHVGEVWVWREGSIYIVNFPTKDDWRNPSQLSWIVSGLDNLKKHVIMGEITSLAMPALGCSNGNLQWSDVLPLIQEKLGELPIEIKVFEPL